ncbi:phosphoinositide 3-kinase adapter protein 1 [Engraulis encrasicolus]|uniref:phosphoinositide 3-kinase adapter protein 1 n=1 Tax=Engraulis encrasicolus TaxID=184585 RepID=UPI002FD62685
MSEVTIVHTDEAAQWASYLQIILQSAWKCPKNSVVLHLVDSKVTAADLDLSAVSDTKCILLLLSTVLLDLQSEPGIHEKFHRLLSPPSTVVVFLCGVFDDEVGADDFEYWDSWRKLHVEDEPVFYVSTVQEAISSKVVQLSQEEFWPPLPDEDFPPPLSPLDSAPSPGPLAEVTPDGQAEEEDEEEEEEEVKVVEEEEEVQQPEQDMAFSSLDSIQENGVSTRVAATATVKATTIASPSAALPVPVPAMVPAQTFATVPVPLPVISPTSATVPVCVPTTAPTSSNALASTTTTTPLVSAHTNLQSCVTVLPERIQCGEHVTVYIILLKKRDHEGSLEMEFSCEGISRRVPGICVNEYTISGESPDMPAGEVTVTLYSGHSAVCSKCLTYYTPMSEISRQLENAADPMQFMCQAFDITCNAAESLDTLLTESLKARMPSNGLRVFGISQLEEENLSVNQRDEELPTLLHFAAKYGLKKLTIVLLQCPGALQAYSVANKHGHYPNKLAEQHGFSGLRQFMDSYLETADIQTDIQDSLSQQETEDIYEIMQDAMSKYSLKEDIYESMREVAPECAEDLYEDMETALKESQNHEDTMLRRFFQVQTGKPLCPEANYSMDEPQWRGVAEGEDPYEVEEDEEDPYNLCMMEQIYDTVEEQQAIPLEILNRPPAPIPRPSCTLEMQQSSTYISRVFSEKETTYSQCAHRGSFDSQVVRPVRDRLLSSAHDPYAGMKTPGQRQLIALQERVKVGSLTVEEAVQEFKAWKFDQDGRTQSIRFQQDNIQRLRDSITRRHKEKGKSPMEDLDITSPLQRNLQWSGSMSLECAVYEPGPRTSAPPPPPIPRPLQRGTWQTGSTSSNSSSESNRLSTLSNISYSSGAEGEMEEPPDLGPLPPRPVRYPDDPPVLPPPRVPPRIPERTPESMLNERYIQSPSRIRPTPGPTPPQRPVPPPPIPRRPR